MNQNNKHRWQFGLLALMVLIALAAITFAIFRPAAFPSDAVIRTDLGIPHAIETSVSDRRKISRPDGAVEYWATIHIAEQPHRLVRVWCKEDGLVTDRAKWSPYFIHDHYDDGTFAFHVCERFYERAPTKAEREAFREFAFNFN